ncbi:MAG UNVERIFIED_CONTAM: excinuclease ABC subunit UvrA [Rickettsiaceae bacterium]|jgi:excinuclease ABC subunit A
MQEYIEVIGAREHNLKNIKVKIPHKKLIVITGLSGSGKSSLAFDTIYAEGQRRYVESLSSYARQFLQHNDKPDVDTITGLSPAIAIDQKTTSKNPRSTVGTITEIYDYLRLLYARIGVPYSPATGLPIQSQTITEMVDHIKELPKGTKVYILAPIAREDKGEFRKKFADLQKQGFERIIVEGEVYDIGEAPVLDKNKKHNIDVIIDRLAIEEDLGNRVADSVETALKIGDGIIYVEIVDIEENAKYKKGERITFSERYSCPVSGFQLAEIEPRTFSFNSPFGACPKCEGIGHEMFFEPDLIVPNRNMSIEEGAIAPWKNSTSKFVHQTLEALGKYYKFSLHVPFKELPENIQHMLFYGSDEEIEFIYTDGLSKDKVTQAFGGIIPSLEEKYRRAEVQWLKDELSKYSSEQECEVCNGYRLKEESLCVKIAGLHIGEVTRMTISLAYDWCKNLHKHLSDKHNQIAARILKELCERLEFLLNVGLEYLSLSRSAGTLSGGESQRIRLASQIGSGLSGVLYVLDEPSIGLHQRDNAKLIQTMKNLRDLGNTVIVVEHDEETMMAADHIIDVGPGAGIHGGQIIAEGTLEDIKNNPNSITGQYLCGKKSIPVPDKLRSGHQGKFIELKGATANNLQNVDCKIPLGTFTVITGVSGSGKSSLIIHTFYKAALKKLENNQKLHVGDYNSISGLEYIDKIIDIDQSPIGRTPRSNPATYTGAFTLIRDLFTELPESKARGYKVGRFSFNVKGGRCEVCQGDGMIKIEMHFLPDVYVKCDGCNGKRYNRETLEIKYKDKSISDILEMTVEDSMNFFNKMPSIFEKLRTLNEVGLGYIRIGQSATTLSGGEAQRIKLAKELSRRSTGRTLYILDEPTTGLHIDDVSRLLKVLHQLVDLGNTVMVIEHNLDVIKTADHVIDVGPEGGNKGGKIIAKGTPKQVSECKESYTGQYLKRFF